MIEETGTVTKVDGIMARVTVHKRGACEGCAAQGSCESTPEGMEIEALNPVRAKEGQTVIVSMKAQTYLKGTMFVYGLPLAIFIAGAIIGKNIGDRYIPDMSSDLVAAITAFAALILSLIGLRAWASKAETKAEYRPVIERIVG
jgi:sigma-E factor negative regulatory protein RseC